MWGIFAAEARHAEVDEMAVLVVDLRFLWPHPAMFDAVTNTVQKAQ